MLQRIKRTAVGQWVKKSKPYRFLLSSQGDWRYPFVSGSWWLAKILVPRRKVSVDGVSFTLSCTNWITHFRWYRFKSKDQDVRRYIDKYVKEGDTFFDIGANVGVFSIYSGKRYSNISIYCFEPEYANLNTLKENIIYNGLMEKVKIYSVAAGNFNGPSNLHLQDTTAGSAVHTESKESIGLTEEGCPVVWSEGIMSVTLDCICEQLGVIPHVMKIDTDGNEDKVFEGAKGILSNKKLRSLVTEMPQDSKKAQRCRELLAVAGFTLEQSDNEKTRNEIWLKR